MKSDINPFINTDRKNIKDKKKCTIFFFSPFVEKDEGITISYKDEEAIYILLASKEDVENI